MSMLDVVSKIKSVERKPFIAPLPAAKNVTVFTMTDGVPFRYSVQSPAPGWWQLRPNPALRSTAIRDREAYPSEYLPYLAELPRFMVYALFKCDEGGSWLVTPYNLSDAAQRGWTNGTPRVVHLVRGTVEPMDILYVRNLAGELLFDDVVTKRPGRDNGAAVRLAESIIDKHDADTRIALAKMAVEQKVKSVRRRMEIQLEFMGARLLGMAGYGDGYTVHWMGADGHDYEMTVKPNTHIDVAGICMNGSDSQHNLSSIVFAMEEARRLGRPDLR